MNQRLYKFGFVGVIGFIVDVTVMAVLSSFLPVIPARSGAFWAAASSTWWCNRRFTFKESDRRDPLTQWLKFLVSACVGFIPNWGSYWLLIEWGRGERITQLVGSDAAFLWPYVAMIPGILLGMVANFILASCWVFQPVAE